MPLVLPWITDREIQHLSTLTDHSVSFQTCEHSNWCRQTGRTTVDTGRQAGRTIVDTGRQTGRTTDKTCILQTSQGTWWCHLKSSSIWQLQHQQLTKIFVYFTTLHTFKMSSLLSNDNIWAPYQPTYICNLTNLNCIWPCHQSRLYLPQQSVCNVQAWKFPLFLQKKKARVLAITALIWCHPLLYTCPTETGILVSSLGTDRPMFSCCSYGTLFHFSLQSSLLNKSTWRFVHQSLDLDILQTKFICEQTITAHHRQTQHPAAHKLNSELSNMEPLTHTVTTGNAPSGIEDHL